MSEDDQMNKAKNDATIKSMEKYKRGQNVDYKVMTPRIQ